MPASFPEALTVVENHAAELGVADPGAYVGQLRAFLDQKPEDGRAAVTIAVDASKSLINIGVAFFAALGAFALTYRSTHEKFSWSWSILLLIASGVVTIISVIAGLNAIGVAYRRGQRHADAAGLPWATRPLSGYFAAQSLAGLAALALFAVAMAVWDANPTGTAEPRIDGVQKRIDDLQGRLDKQGADIARLAPGPAPAPQAMAAQEPVKLDGVIAALNEIKTAVQRPPSAPAAQPSPAAPTPTPRATGEKDLTRADWTKIQESLIARGFNPGRADGLVGGKTHAAIRAYQTSIHERSDGVLTGAQIEDLLGR